MTGVPARLDAVGHDAVRGDVEALVDAYRGDLVAAGLFAQKPVTSTARTFFLETGVEGWAGLSLAEQCALPAKFRRVVSWLIVTGRVRPSPDYLVVCRPHIGLVAAHLQAGFHERFRTTAADLGFRPIVSRLQWSALVRVSALTGLRPEQLTTTVIRDGHAALHAAIGRHHPDSHAAQALSGALFGGRTTLFHMGVLDEAPRKVNPDRCAERAAAWASVAPLLAATLSGYIAQTRLSLRASTMVRVEGALRGFAGWITEHAPEVACVADLRRRHIEAYKLHLAVRPSAKGGKLTKSAQADQIGALRTCFERLTEWGGDDLPSAVLVFVGDLPIRDEPLPRFLDDGAFAKLLQATRNDPDPFVRLAVEFLARTGLRKGEFLDLTVDSVVQIGAAYWLHVPLGKLRTDRYIPLHPQLKDLLDEWIATRPASLRSPYLFIEHGQRVRQGRVDRAVAKTADAAGIGHVNPHRLRHTLATQAINRGMSLEAIAALLGHRSMRMTMVYARIANRTVADEYFAVAEKVEALYNAPRELPADAEGAEMRKLRAEMHRRMLGNGYCARPVGLDCHFESICESCTFFQTTIEFRPTLQAQRDDAADKGQLGRQKVFDGLLTRLEDTAS
jgi:integrase